METINDIDIENILARQYDALGHYLVDDSFTEIRNIREGHSIWCQGKEEFINEAKKLVKSDIYVGINPRNKKSGTSADVSSLCCLVLDIDPVRPRGEASTDSQHDLAMQLGTRLMEVFTGSILVSSGSGAHVYFPIQPLKVTNGNRLTASLSKWMDAIRSEYATKELKIDSIFDLPRIIRIWGSHNTKSNRECGPVGPSREVVRFAYQFAQTKEESEVKVTPELTNDEDRFQRLVRTNSRLRGICDGSITHESGSESDFEFINILHGAGFDPEQIAKLCSHNPAGRAGRKDIASDVRRVIAKSEARKAEQVGETNSPFGSEISPKSFRTDSDRYLTSLETRGMGQLTGLGRLDETISGLKPEKLYIFAARAGEGKTSLITQILATVAKQGKTCLFYPTEVGAEPIWDKIISREAKVNLKQFQNGTFSAQDKINIASAVERMKGLPLMIMEDFAVTPRKIEEGIKRYAPQVVAIDFLQSMAWNNPDSASEKYQACYLLKSMAKKYQIPIILASQLNRTEGKADLRQLSGTSGLEVFGDVIAYIYQMDKGVYPVPTDLLVMKSKYSATGLIKLKFYTSQGNLEVDESWRGE